MIFKRKRQGLTNYKRRLALLKSRKPRLVVRRSNRYLQAQIVSYDPDGDKVLVGLTSKALAQYGLTKSFKSTPAAYLTGLLLGREAKKNGVTEAIVDFGLQRHRSAGVLMAVVKGAIDGGVAIPVGSEVLPLPERLRGEHLATMDAFKKAADALQIRRDADGE